MGIALPGTASIWPILAERLEAERPRPVAPPGLDAFPLFTSAGEPYVLVRAPDGRAFLQLAPWQYELLHRMDGTRTVRDLLLVHLEHHGILDPAEVADLLAFLLAHRLVVTPGIDCYAQLTQRLHPEYQSGSWLGVRWAKGPSWDIPVIARLLLAVGAACARLARTPAVWAVPVLALSSIAAPLLAAVVRHASFGEAPSTLAALVLALWLMPALQAIGAATGCLLVDRRPMHAGLRLVAGIPVPWIDARACLLSGPAGPRTVWLAAPLLPLCAAGIAGLSALAWPSSGAALAVALAWALPSVWLLAPASMQAEGQTALPAVPHLRRSYWWPPGRAIGPRAAPFGRLPALLPGIVWACAMLALLATLWRADLPDLLAAPRSATSPLAVALVVVPLVYVVVCGMVQWALPAARRWAHASRVRRRLPAAVVRRAGVLEQCEALSMLTVEQRLALAERVQELQYPSGFDVVVQGEVGDDFYIVEEGEAEAIDESGPTVLQRYGPGGSFGAYAVIYRALRAATVRAVTDLRLLRIDRPTFDAFLAPRFIQQERLAALVDERRMLKGVPLLRTLREDDLDLLLPRLIAERYDPGTVIIRQGEWGEHFYIVKLGTVEVIDESQTPPRRLNVLGSGDYFGELALLLDLPRVATVRALVEVTVWRLSRADFDLVVARYLGLDRHLAGVGEARLVANRAAGA